MSTKSLTYEPHGSFDDVAFPMQPSYQNHIHSQMERTSVFFDPLVLLDPTEDELFGTTGRELAGYRLTTVDMPEGVTRDVAFSLRSDYIAALSVQSGRQGAHDALVCLGTWDDTAMEWGVHGSLRVDASATNAFDIESNYGKLSFDNDATNKRLTYSGGINFRFGDGTVHFEIQDLDTDNPCFYFYNNTSDASTPSNGAVIYAKSGDLYRRKSDGKIDEWGSGTIDEAADYTMTGTWAFAPSAPDVAPDFQPPSFGDAPFTIGSNGEDQEVSGLKAENSTKLDGSAASAYNTKAGADVITGDWVFGPIASGNDYPQFPSNTKFTQATGTAPFQVDSTTVVTNLHADDSDNLGGTAAASYTLTTDLTAYAKLSDDETVTGDYSFTGDIDVGGGGANGSFTIGAPAGAEAPIILTSPSATVVTGLNADYVDGIHGTALAEIAQAETISAVWTFSTQPSFTNASAPFAVTSNNVVANLRSANSSSADDADALGGVAAAGYGQLAQPETVTSAWLFDTAFQIKEESAPTPTATYGKLYHSSSDNHLYWKTGAGEGNFDIDLTTGNQASDVYHDTGQSTQNNVITLRSITPTTPDKTYFVQSYVVCRGSAGDFDNGFLAVKIYATFYTNSSSVFVRLPDQSVKGSPNLAYDGSGSAKTITPAGDFFLDFVDDSDVIKLKVNGYTNASSNTFEWTAWTRVWSV